MKIVDPYKQQGQGQQIVDPFKKSGGIVDPFKTQAPVAAAPEKNPGMVGQFAGDVLTGYKTMWRDRPRTAEEGRELFENVQTFSFPREQMQDLSKKTYAEGVKGGLKNTGLSLLEAPAVPLQFVSGLYDRLVYQPIRDVVQPLAEGETETEKRLKTERMAKMTLPSGPEVAQTQGQDISTERTARDVLGVPPEFRRAQAHRQLLDEVLGRRKQTYVGRVGQELRNIKDFVVHTAKNLPETAYERPVDVAYLLEMSKGTVKGVKKLGGKVKQTISPKVNAVEQSKIILRNKQNYTDAEIRGALKTLDEANLQSPVRETIRQSQKTDFAGKGERIADVKINGIDVQTAADMIIKGKPVSKHLAEGMKGGKDQIYVRDKVRKMVERRITEENIPQARAKFIREHMERDFSAAPEQVQNVGLLEIEISPIGLKPKRIHVKPGEPVAIEHELYPGQGLTKVWTVFDENGNVVFADLKGYESAKRSAEAMQGKEVGYGERGGQPVEEIIKREAAESGDPVTMQDLRDAAAEREIAPKLEIVDPFKEATPEPPAPAQGASPTQARPGTILSWVRDKGGIDVGRETLRGELKTLAEDRNMVGMLKKKGGRTLDELAGMARDEGIISEATPQALLDSITKNQALPWVEATPQQFAKQAQAAETKASGLREGLEAQYPKEIIDAANLKDGESVTINGEKYTKGTAPDGDILLKDGKTYKLPDDFATISVDTAPILAPQKPSAPKLRPQQQDLVGTPRDALNYPQRAAEMGETPLERGVREAKGRKIEAEEAANQADMFTRESVTTGKLPEVNAESGQVLLPQPKGGFRHFFDSVREFVSPLTSLGKEGKQKYLEKRYKQLGWETRAEDFATKLWEKTRDYPADVKQKMFWYLDGKLDIKELPVEYRQAAVQIQSAIRRTGKMLVDRGLLDEATWKDNQNQYVRYTYLKHILGDDINSAVRSNGKLDMTYLKQRKDLTLDQQRAIGLVEDVSVAAPTSVAKPLSDIGKYDFMDFISKNRDWVWEPSMVTVEGKRMGIGALADEVALAHKMKEQAPNVPEIAKRLETLENKLVEAQTRAGKETPKGYYQFPTSKEYGPLRGAYVRKPIAQDILPVMSGLRGGGSMSNAINKLLSLSEKGMAAFKASHVALNPPTMARNAGSGMIQLNMSGMPTQKIPVYMAKSARAIYKKEALYTQARRHGLFRTNWGQAEVADILGSLKTLENKSYPDIMAGLGELAKQYGKIDDFFKMAKFIEQVEKGKTYSQAAVEAHKWGMDYSLAHPTVKFSRRHLTPFITYQYKILPLLGEAATKRPWVFAKYAAIPWLAKEYVKKMDDISEEDWKQLERDLPMYIRNEGSYAMLPWKSPEGNYQWVNLQYFFPWGNMVELGENVKKVGDPMAGGPGDIIANLGLSNPYADIVYAAFKPARNGQPPRDPFTGQEIYNRLDTPKDKLLKTTEWLYNKWAPGAFTRHGAAGYTYRAAKGEEDRYGRKVTPEQAGLRWFGVNIVAPTPEQSARYKGYLRTELLRSYKALLKEAKTDADRKQALESYQNMLKELNR